MDTVLQLRLAVAGISGLLLALTIWTSVPVAESQVTPLPQPLQQREPPPSIEQVDLAKPEPVERKTILKMVRKYRQTADERWHQTLTDAIYREAMAVEVDPLMVASIVASESSFQAEVVSHAGAVGLMQLRPWVAEDVARRSNVEWRGTETLHSPDLNVRLGALYFKELVERFDGDEHTALAAYNRGPTRVSRQLRTGTFRGCPYADRILARYESLNATVAR